MMKVVVSVILAFAMVSLFCQKRADAYPTEGYDPNEVTLKADQLPKEFENVGIKENLGQQIDMNLQFRNEAGELVTLKDVVRPDKPFILSLVYYSCANLCNFHLNGLTDGLKELKWTVGDEFDVVAISFDSREKWEVARDKKQNYIKSYGRQSSEGGWNFLTGNEEEIKKLTDVVGFSYKYDDKSNEWAHTSAAIMVTPQGKVSRYLHGVHFQRQDLRLGLLEAAQGKVGNIVDSIVLYCFRFDPKKNKYTLYSYNLMKAGATIMVILMAVFLIPIWIRERRAGKNKI